MTTAMIPMTRQPAPRVRQPTPRIGRARARSTAGSNEHTPLRIAAFEQLPLPVADDASASGPIGGFEAYLAEISRIPLLPHKEQAALARRMRAGDAQAKRALFEATLPLVVSVARWYTRGASIEICEELTQIGNLVMWQVMGQYDPDKVYTSDGTHRHGTITFPTYITRYLMARMRRELPNLLSPIYRPAYITDMESRVRRVIDGLVNERGEMPSDRAIEDALVEQGALRKQRSNRGTDTVVARETIAASTRAAHVASLDARREHAQKEGARRSDVSAVETGISANEVNDENSVPSAEQQAWPELDADAVTRVCREVLNEREQFILSARYAHGRTLVEVGKVLGITRERVRQIEADALKKLRSADARGPHQGVLQTIYHEGF